MTRRALLLTLALAGGGILFTATPAGACGDGVARPECPTTTTTTKQTKPAPTTTTVVQACVAPDGTRYSFNGGCYPTPTTIPVVPLAAPTTPSPRLADTGAPTGQLSLLAGLLGGAGGLLVWRTRRHPASDAR